VVDRSDLDRGMSERAERKVMLLDMNAFFASIEQRCNPFLQGRPVLVCGSRSTRTVVVAASYETRPFGARSGMPLGEALHLCPQAIVIEADPPKYLDTARGLQELLLEFSPQVEIFSIDEAFVELHPQDDPIAIAGAIKARLRKRFDLTCSIGIGPNKLVAKLAAGMKKPDGLVWIHREQVPEVFASLPVSELCGIGPKVTQKLQLLGIATAGQLGSFPVAELRARFGTFWGEWLSAMGKGIDPSPVISCLTPPVIKSVGHSYTLPRDTSAPAELRAHLFCLSLMVGRRLRADGFAGRTLRLTLRTSDFTTFCRHRTVPHWLYHGKQIYHHAWNLFESLPWPGPLRMIGIAVASLAKGARQGDLFAAHEKEQALVRAEDAILDRFGEFSIKPAALLALSRKRPNEDRPWTFTSAPADSRSLAGARRFIRTR
jgi:DNA polymerase-4